MTELFHYTTRQGLLGILREGNIRATDAMYMNDSLEGIHGYRLLLSGIEDLVHACEQSPHSKLAEAAVLREVHSWFKDMLVSKPERSPVLLLSDSYVACFSEAADDLNQWRSYCKPGDGYAIGFSKPLLMELSNGLRAAKVCGSSVLRRCSYNDSRLSGALKAIVRELRKIASKPDASNLLQLGKHKWSKNNRHKAGDRDHLMNLLVQGIRDALTQKHPCFESEREHRLIVSERWVDIRFRDGRFSLVPYIEVPIEHAMKAGLIRSIRVGPGPQLDLDVKATRRMAIDRSDDLGFARPSVEPSRVPLRG
jgi:hypothetical protein